MASFVCLKGKAAFAKGSIDWLTDVIRAMPVSAIPNQDTVEFVSDVTGEIGSVRVTLGTKAVNEDAAGDEVELDAADPTFSSVPGGSTMVGMVLYKQVGGDDSTPANDPVIGFIDTPDTATNGGDITVNLATEGAIKL